MSEQPPMISPLVVSQTEHQQKLRRAVAALERYVSDAPHNSSQALADRIGELRHHIEQNDDEMTRIYLHDLHLDSVAHYPRLARALARIARTIYRQHIADLPPTSAV